MENEQIQDNARSRRCNYQEGVSMGKSQRQKGYRGEYYLVRYLKEHGLDVKRIPLSGATDYKKGDIEVEGYTGEVKLRKNGFKELYKWLENADVLFVKADRKEYLAVMPVGLFKDLLLTLKKEELKCGSKE
jgi:hypothetical protein